MTSAQKSSNVPGRPIEVHATRKRASVSALISPDSSGPLYPDDNTASVTASICSSAAISGTMSCMTADCTDFPVRPAVSNAFPESTLLNLLCIRPDSGAAGTAQCWQRIGAGIKTGSGLRCAPVRGLVTGRSARAFAARAARMRLDMMPRYRGAVRVNTATCISVQPDGSGPAWVQSGVHV